MLVLSRKAGESVIVGESLIVTVVRIDGDKVRLGFDGPDHVRRTEVEFSADKALAKELKASADRQAFGDSEE